MICRPATAADIRAYYGEGLKQTVQAYVAELDGEIIGIVGVAKERGYYKLFSEYKPQLKPHLKSMAVLRAVKRAVAMARETGAPVTAAAQPTEPDAPRVLRRLGFEFIEHAPDGDVYEWLG